MQMTFRWFGKDLDTVSLEQIKQIPGVVGVVPALHYLPAGEAWEMEDVQKMYDEITAAGLTMECIESVNVHEDIKLGLPTRDKLIENYKKSIRNLAKVGVKVICYNFMPVFDWTRSQLDHKLPDGSEALVYYKEDVDKLDPTKLTLPGWDSSYKPSEVKELIEAYKELGEEGLWANLKYFLEEIIPVARECDVLMAIHPDDPAWPIFGIPRIITSEKNLDRFLSLVDDHYNGLTLCSGSLGTNPLNDMVHLVKKYAAMDRIHFAHIRNIKLVGEESFEESAHYSKCGSLDMFGMIKAYHDAGYTKYIRPDHGRMIWDEKAKPGYGLYDRALGSMYITGIWEALDRMEEK